MNYCKLWQAIISADLEGIKEYSEKMDVGEYYGIFACMLAARTWNTVVSGMKRTPFSQNEVSAGAYPDGGCVGGGEYTVTHPYPAYIPKTRELQKKCEAKLLSSHYQAVIALHS